MWWTRELANPWFDPQGDVLIVLGADGPISGMVGNGTYWRSVYAVRAWRAGHFQRIVISGGEGTAESIQQFMACAGVPPGIMQLENQSTSTHENALFTARLLKDVAGKKVLLTSDYHIYRAARTFSKAGLQVVPAPFADGIKHAGMVQYRWPVFIELLRESAKILGYRARGWI
jgi:uncharacterized SAM-binding protein YcdF (DUF218 family)